MANLLSYILRLSFIVLICTNETIGQNDTNSTSSNYTTRHVVQKGETLFSIAYQYKVTIDSILYWNHLITNHLNVGKTLLIHANSGSQSQNLNVATKEVTMRGKTQNESSSDEVIPRDITLHCVTIGVTNYDDSLNIPELEFTKNDALDLKALFRKQKGTLYQDIRTHAIVDNPIRDTIMEALSNVAIEARDSDVIMVFISAHALVDRNHKLCIIPKDYDFYEERNAIVLSDILRLLVDAKCPKVIVLDVCNAGQAATNLLDAIHNLGSEFTENLAIIVGASAFQEGEETSKWKHGALTQVILDGLASGDADSQKGNGIITIPELAAYISNKVSEITDRKQDASMPINFVGNLPIFQYKKVPVKPLPKTENTIPPVSKTTVPGSGSPVIIKG